MELMIVTDDGTVHEVDGNIETLLSNKHDRRQEVLTRIYCTLRVIEGGNLIEGVVTCLMKDFFLEPDGHTIFSPEHYLDKGMPSLFVLMFAKVHYKGGGQGYDVTNPKGIPIKDLLGVYNLELLQGVVDILEIEISLSFPAPYNCDTRARQLHTAIMKHIVRLKEEGFTSKV